MCKLLKENLSHVSFPILRLYTWFFPKETWCTHNMHINHFNECETERDRESKSYIEKGRE